MKRRHNHYTTLLIVLLLLAGQLVHAAVWQWSVPVKQVGVNKDPSRAFLWIPPGCKQVKAVIFAQNNMEEQSILEDSEFRSEMGKLGVAEIWVSPAFNLKFLFNEGAGEQFNTLINDLSDISGYIELKIAPVIPMGHSAAASAPYYFGAWNPSRTLACISVSGQWPYVRNAFAPDIWSKDQTLDYIPCLETMGEYEAANTWSEEGLKERQEHSLLPLSMLSNPAQGHFATTREKNAYLAFYIKKAIQYRLPQNVPMGAAPKLIDIDPTKTGWLVDKWRYNELPVANPAPVGNYKGDASKAFWYFDEETAKVTTAYQAKHRNQTPQLIGYVQHGQMLEQHNTHQQVNLQFEPDADGITFKLHATFYETVPGGSPRLPVWSDRAVGSSIGHAAGNTPVAINPITGPVIKLNDSTFRLNPRAGYWENPHSYELWFAATHPGDAEYKPAVQQSLMIVPPRNTIGQEQHITFSLIPNQKQYAKGIKLDARSDAHVPVGFYVLEGPAELSGGALNITDIPPRSRFPIKVTVVAWQYGNSHEPKLQTATPVEQSFFIEK
ncbi:hypothetical protein SAMN05192574_103582 [Mucilaginibacter gossypiicola]|uniref:Uncharacterized protein n=1 Tax=Mucilaginibacter gossypiicola TaxID=551995 RepID=A0A1H8HPJ3_9SPHI|nr:hypothetical protein [Mucilaginibacter gossypiicola]SEN57934.1 hypothetical protein SAMN05192574_103582 [Mucilaginibacter gossypiicola]